MHLITIISRKLELQRYAEDAMYKTKEAHKSAACEFPACALSAPYDCMKSPQRSWLACAVGSDFTISLKIHIEIPDTCQRS